MATTETRTGFRLPWSSEPRDTDETPAPAATDESATSESATSEAVAAEGQIEPAMVGTVDSASESAADPATTEADAQPEAAPTYLTAESPAVEEAALPDPTPVAETMSTTMPETFAAPSARAASTTPAKRPTKFLADLTRAMQAAAEAERAEILERFHAESKVFVERVNERSGIEATELRKLADDDVASIRDWSKAEIARIREETDERIADRKSRLDGEIEAHAARIEREIERVKATVDGFEADMARFFEGLMNEDDPTSFAERAARLPEPPSLDDVVATAADEPSEPTVAKAAPVRFRASEPVSARTLAEPAPASQDGSPLTDAAPTDAPSTEPTAETETPEAEAQAPEVEAPVAEAAAPEPASTEADNPAPDAEMSSDGEAPDPRVAALGLTPDFAAAEAEALANVDADHGEDGSGEDIPALDDDTIAARLAGLPQPAAETADDTRSTQVVVTGLVSVASIAGFKRHLSRLPGVRAVGVASGPDGEFLFSVQHGDEVALHEAIPTLPSFAARITANGEGVLHVSARDPETDA